MGINYNIIYLNILFIYFIFFGMKWGRFGGAAKAFGGGGHCPCLELGPVMYEFILLEMFLIM